MTMPPDRDPELNRVDPVAPQSASRTIPGNPKVVVDDPPVEDARAGTPMNWRLYGLVGLAIVIAIVLFMQIFSGAPGTDVAPGSPTAEPVVAPVE